MERLDGSVNLNQSQFISSRLAHVTIINHWVILGVSCSRIASAGVMTHHSFAVSQPPKGQSWLVFRMMEGFQEKGQKGTRYPENLTENWHSITSPTSFWQKQVQVHPRIRVGEDKEVRDQRTWIQGSY